MEEFPLLGSPSFSLVKPLNDTMKPATLWKAFAQNQLPKTLISPLKCIHENLSSNVCSDIWELWSSHIDMQH